MTGGKIVEVCHPSVRDAAVDIAKTLPRHCCCGLTKTCVWLCACADAVLAIEASFYIQFRPIASIASVNASPFPLLEEFAPGVYHHAAGLVSPAAHPGSSRSQAVPEVA
jgi:hypothetical protein